MASKNAIKIVYRNPLSNKKYNYDFNILNDQYVKAICFIESASDELKSDLKGLLFPVFVHFYLEFMLEGKKEDAEKFCSLHDYSFSNVPSCADIISKLNKLKSFSDVYDDSRLKLLKTAKYIIRLSKNSILTFKDYLNEVNAIKVIQFLEAHFTFQYTDDIEQSEAKNNISAPPNFSNDQILAALEDLDTLPTPFPSIELFSICNTPALSSASLSSDGCTLSGGSLNSLVYVWQLRRRTNSKDVDSDELTNYLFDTTNSLVLHGHYASVHNVVFDSSNEYLFSCSSDCTVKLWATNSFELKQTYIGHNDTIFDLDVFSTSKNFITASKDNNVSLYDIENIKPIQSFRGHKLAVNCVVINPDEKYFASGSDDKTICIWNHQNKSDVTVLPNSDGKVTALAFSPNGKYLVSAHDNHCVKVWDLQFQSVLQKLFCKLNKPCKMSFKKDGTMLAVSGLENFIEFYDFCQDDLDFKRISLDLDILEYSPNSYKSSYHVPNLNFRFIRFEDYFLSSVGIKNKV